ncbi:damage-inducible protein DinB [bacterium 336/3]|nr:damage-inducible protein DinB [bacterium 336/3]
MKAFFKEIFEYHHYFNQKLVEEIEKNKDVLPENTYRLFCHILNAHHIWNARIVGVVPLFAVQQVHLVQELRSIDVTNYESTSKILDVEDLEKVIDYKTSKGEPFSNTIRDILFHIANHSTHHKAQIASQMRQNGITPIITDYIFYKR